MNKKSIGEKIQALAKIVLIVELVISAAMLALGLYSLHVTEDVYPQSLEISSWLTYTNMIATKLLSGVIGNVLTAVVIYFCMIGFGHLLINSDKAISLLRSIEASKAEPAPAPKAEYPDEKE